MVACKCGQPATANGRECPKHYRERLASVKIGPGALETRTKVDYFDRSSLDESFGHDRVDRYWDETEGDGALDRQPDGSFTHTNWRGETQVADDETIERYVGGEDADDA